jgi:hypothetical protein
MLDNLTKQCLAAYEKHVTELFDEAERRAKGALARGKTNVCSPITGFVYDSWSDKDTERAKRIACAALLHCERHRCSAPAWAQPLPVHCDRLGGYKLDYKTPPRMQLLQTFAESLCYHWWDPAHPLFVPYACSIMANKYAPDTIRENRDLEREFPPQKLVELRPDLHWMKPAKVREAR